VPLDALYLFVILALIGPGYFVLLGVGFSNKDIERNPHALVIAGLFAWAMIALFAVVIWAVFVRTDA